MKAFLCGMNIGVGLIMVCGKNPISLSIGLCSIGAATFLAYLIYEESTTKPSGRDDE